MKWKEWTDLVSWFPSSGEASVRGSESLHFSDTSGKNVAFFLCSATKDIYGKLLGSSVLTQQFYTRRVFPSNAPPKPQTCFRRIRQHEEREFNLLIQTYFFFYLYFISASSSLIRFNAIFKTFPPKSNPAQHRHTNEQWTLFTFLNIKCLKGENIDKKLFSNINTGLIHEYKQ